MSNGVFALYLLIIIEKELRLTSQIYSSQAHLRRINLVLSAVSLTELRKLCGIPHGEI